MQEDIVKRIKETGNKVKENVERVIVGKSEVVELVIATLLCEGHILIDDVPGIGKTMLAKSIAKSLGCSFGRIQFTPDLLPSDITGTHIFNQKSSEFEYKPGPIMTQVILADEINRATPRTQAAMLEAMQERQVTVEGETIPLSQPFLVLATQNPIELEGTFPLPEAQLDRFLLKIKLGYPTKDDDRVILNRFRKTNPLDELEPMVSADELVEMQTACHEIHATSDIEDYVIQLIHATREHEYIELGSSPRAMLALFQASQALAALRGRTYVLPDDVKYLARYVLSHRIILKADSYLRGITAEQALEQIVDTVPVPAEVHAGAEER